MTQSPEQQINQWITEVFKLPESSVINIIEREIKEEKYRGFQTEVTVNLGDKLSNRFSVPKALEKIRKEDIEKIKKKGEESFLKKNPVLGYLLRFFGLWFAFSGLYAMFAVCPFCGQVGCPVGAGSAGIIGVFCAIFFQVIRNWKASLNYLYSRIFGTKV